MERMKKNGTYEIHKQNMIDRYHNKIKNNPIEIEKRCQYYKQWYNKNKYEIQQRRSNYYYNNKKKEYNYYCKNTEKIFNNKPIIKFSKESFILRFD